MAKFNSAFARQLENTPVRGAGGVEKPIRDWLNPADDDFSEALITPTGGDTARALADWFGSIVDTVGAGTYTLLQSDHGKTLLFTAECTITVPAGLAPNFVCGLVQMHAINVITVVESGTTIYPAAERVSDKQGGLLSIVGVGTNTFLLIGAAEA